MREIILHHYDSSPFSEKVRLALGLKGLPWRSVVIPNIMPRPELMPLTGGYRRTPVMQIGADIYCDSQMIVRELERRFPEPALFPPGTEGAAWALSTWTDRDFFQCSVTVIFGNLEEGALPEAFFKDREQLSGRSFDPAAMRQAAPAMLDQWRAHAHRVETQLRDRRTSADEWLLGDRPSYADLTAYMNFWFMAGAYAPFQELVGELAEARQWMERVRALGHGERAEMSSTEALEVGRDSTPETESAEDASDPNRWRPGDRVSVMPDDYGRIPVIGELVASSPHHVAIRRQDELAGEVVVHFPRAGFTLARTEGAAGPSPRPR